MSFHDSMSFSTWDVADLTLDDVRRALAARDPDLPWLVVRLASGRDPQPKGGPPREGALTLDAMLAEMRGYAFGKKTLEQRAAYRRETLAALEAPDAEVALPPRFGLDDVVLELWAANGPYERQCLLEIIAHVPLRWGPWRALKRMFKDAEARGDIEILGALAARFDSTLSMGAIYAGGSEVSRPTLVYLVRRAWRFLRRTAESMPALYADAACAMLRFYPEATVWPRTWIAAHIFWHETGKYSRSRFRFGWRGPQSLLKHRAYEALWQRTPRPLFTLLERARSSQAQRFATEALKTDFRATLREVEPAWVARLVAVGSAAVDDFAVWVLGNVPRFEQGAFRELGLHEAVLRLLDSPSMSAREYAAGYARTHARDLGLERLLELANNAHDAVRRLAADLLRDRDPRKDVGLEAWGRLLGTDHAHELAAEVLRKHFGARELTPEWFAERLLAEDWRTREFATERLLQVHKLEALGPAYFIALLDDERVDWQTVEFATESLARFKPDALELEELRRLLLHPQASGAVVGWLDERIPPESLGADFLKRLAFHPDFERDPWVAALRARYRWARELSFDEDLRDRALEWLADVRRFSPTDLGFDWLMQLVARTESAYHDFAVDYMTRAFVPADFAPASEAPAAEAAPATSSDVEIKVDLGGASFLFTGKLATMSRKEATSKVTAAGGANASGVSPKLDYLVIGDEGSPLYGQGRKGSKQVKAEELAAEGAAIRIISETAFLQMLSGEQREFSEDAVAAGSERLWALATTPPSDAPLAAFARHYIRRHHPEIGLALTDRPVDPGAEIPDSFLTFERVRPLLGSADKALRELGLELAAQELARWSPPIEAVVELAELPYVDVRAFVRKALLADASREHRRYRIDPAVLTPEAVYGFCESLDAQTRELGMLLIARDAKLAVPEELFRLTESPDRQVRAFAIRTFWSLYRERGITQGWAPAPPPSVPEVSRARGRRRRAEQEQREAAADPRASAPGGAPARPEQPPASDEAMRELLRRILFGIPPARLPRDSAAAAASVAAASGGEGDDDDEGDGVARGGVVERLRPLPARRAKQALVEVVRDLAVEDRDFAVHVAPVLVEFLPTRGMSERAACLVALTRIHKAFPELALSPAEDLA